MTNDALYDYIVYVTCARDEHTMVGMLVYSNFYHDCNTFHTHLVLFIMDPTCMKVPRASTPSLSSHHQTASHTQPHDARCVRAYPSSAPRLSRAPRLSHSLRSLHHTHALSTLPGPRPRTLPSLGAAVPPEQRRDAGTVLVLGPIEGGLVVLHRTQAPSAAPHPPGGVPLTLSLAFTSARAPRSAPATAS